MTPDYLTHNPPRLLRRREVERRTGLKKSSIYAFMKEGKFPQSIKIGPKAVGWLDSEINAFVLERCKRLGVQPLWMSS